MAGSSADLHESKEDLSPDTVDRHRAVVSLMEELEAVDWYDQRVDAATDDELRAILAHNRDEEKEHAAMLLEWLRRHDPGMEEELESYLFKRGRITELEHEEGKEEADTGTVDSGLGVGSLKE
ncbi:MAG: ferritin-like domain-containing protein [Pseudomonadales bacterium]|jgi:hypothetical protein